MKLLLISSLIIDLTFPIKTTSEEIRIPIIRFEARGDALDMKIDRRCQLLKTYSKCVKRQIVNQN